MTTLIPRRVVRLCHRSDLAALPVPVACPLLVPSVPVPYPLLNGAIRWKTDGAGWLITLNNGGSDPKRLLHWIFGVAAAGLLRSEILKHGTNVGMRTVCGIRVQHYRFDTYPAGGIFGGHILAIVSGRHWKSFGTVHGWERGDASSVIAIAQALAIHDIPAPKC